MNSKVKPAIEIYVKKMEEKKTNERERDILMNIFMHSVN